MEQSSLSKKLGIKTGFRVSLQNIPEEVKDLLKPLPQEVELLTESKSADLFLLFAIDSNELTKVFLKTVANIKSGTILWIAYPKGTSKVKTDLSRDKGWELLTENGYTGVSLISINPVWSAMRFKKNEDVISLKVKDITEIKKYIDFSKRKVVIPEDLQKVLRKNTKAFEAFNNLSFTYKKEHVLALLEAKKIETRKKRLIAILNILLKK